MSWPHLLSISRILAAVPIAALIYSGRPASLLGAAALFGAASLTDLLDGPLARRGSAVSPFGVYLDTTGDKVLVSVVLIALTAQHLVDGWATMVIVAREFLVSSIRTLAGVQGLVISANFAGKLKALVTMLAIVIVLLWANAQAGGVIGRAGGISVMQTVAWLGIALAAALTVWSGIKYGVDAKSLYSGPIPGVQSGDLETGARETASPAGATLDPPR